MQKPYHIIIVGGGTAGWMFATAISALYKSAKIKITLVESEQIGSVGVGEATLPQMKSFNQHVGIDEQEMMRETNATFKLGIKFKDWGALGEAYFHPFGQYGKPLNGNDFHQYWFQLQREMTTGDLADYSYAIQLCLKGRFEFPAQDLKKIESNYAYAYHFDASLYAKFLREKSEKSGVIRREGMIRSLNKDPKSGEISSLVLQNGEQLEGDFFIDCSGFKSLLLGQSLNVEFEDWSSWLLCDRAIAMPSEKLNTIPPYTLSMAKEAGWQWRIPLQHRSGNGYVYCSHFLSDDEALDSLFNNIKGRPIGEPKLLQFKAGRYKKSWSKNCVALGLSSGFLEPLESTSIYLIQIAITTFLRLFPMHNSEVLAQEYNRIMDNEYDRIRDFIILHYHLNQRTDSELWRYCQNMTVPDSLLEKMALFKQRGYVDNYKFGLFNLPSWISVLHGQGQRQATGDPFVSNVSLVELEKGFGQLNAAIRQGVQAAPYHEAFINQYCASLGG